MSIGLWVVLAACAIAVVTDIRFRKIPNWLVGIVLVVALTLGAIHGVQTFFIALGILIGVTIIGFFAYRSGWLGGGDVKFLAVGASALGLQDTAPFLLYTAIGGGVLGLVWALAVGRLGEIIKSIILNGKAVAHGGAIIVDKKKALKLPYGIAIAFGAVAVALSHTYAPYLQLHFFGN